MLIDIIRTDMTAAMKARDAVKLRSLRAVIAAVQEAEVSGREATKLDDDGVMKVIAAQVKRRVEAAEAFDAGDRPEKASDERAEMAVLEAYLPAGLSDDELVELVASLTEASFYPLATIEPVEPFCAWSATCGEGLLPFWLPIRPHP